jgi:diphthine-ammonia ligase
LCRTQELRYRKTEGDEVEDLERLLRAVQEKYPDVRAVCSGAIASNYQRLRVENVCSRLGLISLAYLWKQDQAHLLQQMVMNSKTFFFFSFVFYI